MANAGKNILQRPSRRIVIVNVIGRQQGDIKGFRGFEVPDEEPHNPVIAIVTETTRP